MQTLARTSTLGTTYTAAQVASQLTNPSGETRWIFDRLNVDGLYVADVTPYVKYGSAQIDHDTSREVHRQFQCSIRADAQMNWLSDGIRVHQQTKMPDGGWVDFVLGTFSLQLPKKTIARGVTWRDVQAYDYGVYLTNAQFTSSYTARAGTPYTFAASEILANSYPLGQTNLVSSSTALAAAMLWDPGKTKLSAVNDLLGGLAYNGLWFDEMGVARSEPLSDYTVAQASYTFDTTLTASGSGDLISTPITETPDLTNAYNQVAVIVEDPQRASISVVYNNVNPLSPISQANIVYPRTTTIRDSTIAGVAQAMAVAKAKAQEYARIYTTVQLDTFPWPVSQNLDVYGANWITSDDGLSEFLYVETRWVYKCEVGKPTSHYLSRIVPA